MKQPLPAPHASQQSDVTIGHPHPVHVLTPALQASTPAAAMPTYKLYYFPLPGKHSKTQATQPPPLTA
jgi:hypothetical protein